MSMKRYILAISLFAALSCNNWLTEDGPMVSKVEDYMTSSAAAQQLVIATYVPLMWEYNNTYYCEFFIGDIVSDDALKGGQNISDMADSYDMENFKTIANNTLLTDYYRAQYQGISRANLAIEQVSALEIGIDDDFTEAFKAQLIGEAKFLRALYYFKLVRMYGGIPLVTEPIYSSADWIQPRASVDEVYAQIVADLAEAAEDLPLKSEYSSSDLGRATSGAAQALLLKAYLYWGDYAARNDGNASEYYALAKSCGEAFLAAQAAEYSLNPDYSANFALETENGVESIFEVQYMKEGTSDYGEGNGFTRGTFATILMRSRSEAFGNAGWGFNKPTQNLYDEYESGDPRLEATILVPTDEEITNESDEIYLGNRYMNLKRVMFDLESRTYPNAIDNDMRSGMNNVLIRLADVYLMYAEVCLNCGDAASAKTYLELVRARARGSEDVLPAFPNYSVPDYAAGYALRSLSDNDEDLQLALRHERRVELAMESHRWFDLCRWGIAKEVMDAYKATETDEAVSHMAEFVAGKHELFPIPDDEISLGQIEQNPGY